jgi:hypothetical protein
MDEGLAIAYQVLDEDVPVYSSSGAQVGTVDHVVAAPEVDIFHGLVIQVGKERRFVAAEHVSALHERGVDLAIDESQVAALPEPHGAAPVYRDAGPADRPSRWEHLVNRLSGRGGTDAWRRQD